MLIHKDAPRPLGSDGRQYYRLARDARVNTLLRSDRTPYPVTHRNAIVQSSLQISRRDAETLLAHIVDRDRAWLLAHMDDDLSPEHAGLLESYTSRRASCEPLQHILGTQEFFGLT